MTNPQPSGGSTMHYVWLVACAVAFYGAFVGLPRGQHGVAVPAVALAVALLAIAIEGLRDRMSRE